MIEGPYKSNGSGWVSARMADLEVIGLIVNFLAGCYFIGKVGFAFFVAGAFLKLATLVMCVLAIIGLLLIVSHTWRIVAIVAFASLGPFIQYVSA